nr:HEXXH motif-containing putative peptide modification protein [Streptomyces boncukensis]
MFSVGPGRLAQLARTRLTGADRALLAEGLHSRRLVLLKSLQRRLESGGAPGWAREAFVRHWDVLERAERQDAAAVRAVLGYPSVGVWLAGALGGRDWNRTLAHFGAVAAAAALHAGAGYRGVLETVDGALALPGVGVYRARAPRVRLAAEPRGLRLTAPGRRPATVPRTPPPGPGAYGACAPHPLYGAPPRDPPGWRGPAALPGTGALLDGLDPYRLPPPDSAATGLLPPRRTPHAGGGAAGWRRRWEAAVALLAAADPERAVEVTELTRALVPLGQVPGTARSATLRAAPWAVLTGYPPSPPRLAEVLVHELQHSKLAVIGDLVPLHHDSGAAVHRVGWRPDLRPLAGVLQGTFAHLALADMWYRLAACPGLPPGRRRAALARAGTCGAQVADALGVLLRSGQLTAAGLEFARGMGECHADLRSIVGEVSGGSGSGTPGVPVAPRTRE